MKEFYMLYPKISHNKTGIVVSMLRRAELLANAGYKVFLYTIQYDALTRIHFNECYASGLLTNRENIKLINLFSFFQRKELDNHCVLIDKPHNNCEYDKNGNRVYKDKFNKNKRYEVFHDNRLTHINYFDESILNARSKYDDYGKLCTFQTLVDKKVINEFFYDIYGKLVLKINFSYKKDVKKINSICLFDQFGMVEKEFDSLIDLAVYTLKEYICIKKNILYYFFIDRITEFFPFLLGNNPSNYFFIGTIHAAHYTNYLDIFSAPNKRYTHYFNNLDKLAALVILTHAQKEDIIKVYGESSCYKVIPHTLSKKPHSLNLPVDPLQFISLARYDKGKRLDLLIEIFAEVLKTHPDAKLNMYGFGLEHENLQLLIDSMQLTHSIKLFPFAKNINPLLQSSSMLILTSRSESFCLVVMEALANGCPVTSFDIRYGPSEMIVHKKNGYLVEGDDKKLYAQTLIDYLNTSDIFKQGMRSNAIALSEQTSSEVVLKKWQDLIEEIEISYKNLRQS